MSFHAAIVIPTKNAMPNFARVLAAVTKQMAPWLFEIIVIDSGSRDGTLALARSHPEVRTIEIPPKDFGHGRTRNQAIAASSAPFVAFLTHDAEPANADWLVNLVSAVEQNERIAGAFGRHIANRDASPFTRRDLDDHFAGFLQHPLIVSRDLDEQRYSQDVGWRQFLHFYSDNNSCLRRSVWEQIPYPDVEFAEDQIWADKIIAAGYAKAYAPDAVVYHSHEYRAFERLQRSFDEAKAFRDLFGYELGSSLSKALLSAMRLGARDLRFARQEGFLGQRPLHVMGRMVENAALVFGHVLGTRADKLPTLLARRLSRDKTLHRQT